MNPASQSTTTDFCGQTSDPAFGQQKFTDTLGPELVNGWGVRPGDWQYGVSVQQEVLPRVSVEIGYNHRWLTNFVVTDNLLQAPSDFGQFAITAPTDSRLPSEAQGRDDLRSVQRQPERRIFGLTVQTLARTLRNLFANGEWCPVQHQRQAPKRARIPGRREHGQRPV